MNGNVEKMTSLLSHLQQTGKDDVITDDVITSSMTTSNQVSDSLDPISSISSIEFVFEFYNSYSPNTVFNYFTF